MVIVVGTCSTIGLFEKGHEETFERSVRTIFWQGLFEDALLLGERKGEGGRKAEFNQEYPAITMRCNTF